MIDIDPEIEVGFREALQEAFSRGRTSVQSNRSLLRVVKSLRREVLILRKAFDESTHPRDDAGRWVSSHDLAQAGVAPLKAERLRASVTDPEQRAKLESQIEKHADNPKVRGIHSLEFVTEHLKEHAAQAAGTAQRLFRGMMESEDAEEFLAEIKPWAKKTKKRMLQVVKDETERMYAQLKADYPDVDDEHFQKLYGEMRAKAEESVIPAVDKFADELAAWVPYVEEDGMSDRLRKRMAEDFRDQHESLTEAVGGKAMTDAFYDTLEKHLDDKAILPERKHKLGRYFKAIDCIDPETGEIGRDGPDFEDRIAFLRKSFDEAKHPRDDGGRFVSADRITAAKGNKEKMAALRAEVTDPAEREKLDAKLDEKDVDSDDFAMDAPASAYVDPRLDIKPTGLQRTQDEKEASAERGDKLHHQNSAAFRERADEGRYIPKEDAPFTSTTQEDEARLEKIRRREAYEAKLAVKPEGHSQERTAALLAGLPSKSGTKKTEHLEKIQHAFLHHSHKEIAAIKAKAGIKASGTKAEQAKKIAERAAVRDRSNRRHYSHEPITVDEAVKLIRGHDATAPGAAGKMANLLASRLTGKQLVEVKKKLGIKASGTKWETANRIIKREAEKPVPQVDPKTDIVAALASNDASWPGEPGRLDPKVAQHARAELARIGTEEHRKENPREPMHHVGGTWTKAADGSWHVKVPHGDARPGDTVTVRTKAGTEKTVKLGETSPHGDGSHSTGAVHSEKDSSPKPQTTVDKPTSVVHTTGVDSRAANPKSEGGKMEVAEPKITKEESHGTYKFDYGNGNWMRHSAKTGKLLSQDTYFRPTPEQIAHAEAHIAHEEGNAPPTSGENRLASGESPTPLSGEIARFTVTASGRDFSKTVERLKRAGAKFDSNSKEWRMPQEDAHRVTGIGGLRQHMTMFDTDLVYQDRDRHDSTK